MAFNNNFFDWKISKKHFYSSLKILVIIFIESDSDIFSLPILFVRFWFSNLAHQGGINDYFQCMLHKELDG